MKRITLAIDWYSGTWKWTTARLLAKKLSYTYLDTWAMYRAVTLYAIRHNLLEASDQIKAEIVDRITLDFQYNKETDNFDIYLDSECVEGEIRSPDLWFQLKHIVTCRPLREKLVVLQRAFSLWWWVVVDWRDIGTVVYPEAEVKVFMICDVDVRAERRWKQLKEQWVDTDIEQIKKELIQRDTTDYLWTDAVNKKAEDALVLDTTYLTIQEQVESIYKKVQTLL